MIAIHPYMLTQIMPVAACEDYPTERRFFRAEAPDAAWRAPIDMVYTLMSGNGDGHKQMLPIHTFRLYCPDHDVYEPGFQPQGEHCFGLFEKGEDGAYHPRKKAFALQKIYGWTGELSQAS